MRALDLHKPNILFLTIDALRADMLGCYGHPNSVTPNLDKLAETGTRFDQAITVGSWTQGAFPGIFTSTYASMYGGCLRRLAPERPSPIEALARAGYTTAGFSTNPHVSRSTDYDRGFDIFVDLVPDEQDPPLRNMRGGQRLLRSPLTHYLLAPLGKIIRPARVYSSAQDVVDVLSNWLNDVAHPFFAWAHFMDAHWPYHIEERLTQPQEIAQAWQDLETMHRRANFKRDKLVTPSQRDRFVELYLRSLQFLDAQIGCLLDRIEASKHGANTIVVVVSDHGEEFLDHGRLGHWESNLHDEIIRVPFIVHLPEQPRGHVVGHQVSTIDIMPTFFDLCGIPAEQGMLGRSLVPLLDSVAANVENDLAITEMWRDTYKDGLWHRISLRSERFKLIWDNRRPDRPELYDLRADPDEIQNVSMKFPDEVRGFMDQVSDHLHRVEKTEPVNISQEIEFDREVKKRLQDLGYLA
jgi:arylsulfatase A-like enzyme